MSFWAKRGGRILALALGFLPLFVGAQVEEPPSVYVPESIDARNRLRQTDSYLRQSQWIEAVDALQKLIESFPDKLVPVGGATNLYWSVRAECHSRISRLPDEALAAYRDRVDPQAADLIKRFEATGDLALLQRVADEFFASSSGDRALEKLADRAMTMGKFAEAAAGFAQLLPDELLGPKAPEDRLRYPGPKVDAPRVAAKRILALTLDGDLVGARRSLDALAAKHPQASGSLAGSNRPYVATLGEILGKPESFTPPPEDPEWQTFAGNPRRSKIARGPVDVGDIQWSWTIKDDTPGAQNPFAREFGDERLPTEESLPYHPILAGGSVVLATERSLRSFNLETGKEDKWEEFQPDAAGQRSFDAIQNRFTLTAAGDHLFARTGVAIENQRFMIPRGPVFGSTSRLFCYHLRTQRQLWEVQASGLANDGAVVFDGAPLVDGDNVFIALTRVDAMHYASVACLDRLTGKPKWRTLVCEATLETDDGGAPMRNLLTYADGVVYYGTNLGAVAAIDGESGKLRWVATYPRGRRGGPRFAPTLAPDLNPAVYQQGRLFVAPSDAAGVYCFDAAAGRKLWEARVPVQHILGVGRGVLVVTGDRVWGIDIVTGKLKWYWPENAVRGYGRGALAGDYVYWPTKTEIHVIDQATGQKAFPSIELYNRLRLKGGNLLIGPDHLVIAQANRLVALAPHSRVIKKLEESLVANPRSAELHLKMAAAARATGAHALATTHLRQALSFASPEQVYQGRPIRELAAEQLHASLTREARSRQDRGAFVDAAAHYRQAVLAAPNGAAKRASLADLADLWLKAGQPVSAVAALQEIVEDESLSDVAVPAEKPEGASLAAPRWAAKRISELLVVSGASAYAEVERRAAEARGASKNPAELVRAAARFPNSPGSAVALIQAAGRLAEAGRLREARGAYRLALDPLAFAPASDAEPNERAAARTGLDRVLAREGLSAAARSRYLAESLGKAPLGEAPASQHVALRRAADLEAGEGDWIVPDGDVAAEEQPILARRSGAAISLAMGQPPRTVWTAELGGRAEWVGQTLDGVLVLTRERLRLLGLSSGQVVWERLIPEPDGPQAPAAALCDGDQTWLLEPGGRLLALDSGNGALRFERNLSIQGGRLKRIGSRVVARCQSRLALVDSRNGRLLGDWPLHHGERDEAIALAGDTLILTTEPAKILAVSLADGAKRWEKSIVWPSHQPPRLLARGTDLVALVDGYQAIRFDVSSGRVDWTVALSLKPLPDHPSAAALAPERLLHANAGWLEGRNLKDGSLAWRRPLERDRGPARVHVVGSTVIVADGGEVSAWDARTGERRQSLSAAPAEGSAELVLAGRRAVLIAPGQSWLLALETSSAKP